jgi:hypothetical protein
VRCSKSSNSPTRSLQWMAFGPAPGFSNTTVRVVLARGGRGRQSARGSFLTAAEGRRRVCPNGSGHPTFQPGRSPPTSTTHRTGQPACGRWPPRINSKSAWRPPVRADSVTTIAAEVLNKQVTSTPTSPITACVYCLDNRGRCARYSPTRGRGMAARVRPARGGRVGSHRGRGAGHGWIAPEPAIANSYHLTPHQQLAEPKLLLKDYASVERRKHGRRYNELRSNSG